MKKSSLFILLLAFVLIPLLKAQDQDSEKGKIYFLRSTGYTGSATAFKVFIDDEFVCKLNNKKFSIHEVAAGSHTCSVQFGGKKSKEGAEQFEVNVEPGGIVYVQVVLETGAIVNNTYCEEITENTAIQKMKGMVEDTKCL